MVFFLPAYIIKLSKTHGKEFRTIQETGETDYPMYEVHEKIFEECRSDELASAQYLAWTMYKRMLFVYILMVVENNVFFQIMPLVVLQMMHVTYLYRYKPLLHKELNKVHITDELMTLLIIYFFFLLSNASLPPQSKKQIGWIIIFLILINIAINLKKAS